MPSLNPDQFEPSQHHLTGLGQCGVSASRGVTGVGGTRLGMLHPEGCVGRGHCPRGVLRIGWLRGPRRGGGAGLGQWAGKEAEGVQQQPTATCGAAPAVVEPNSSQECQMTGEATGSAAGKCRLGLRRNSLSRYPAKQGGLVHGGLGWTQPLLPWGGAGGVSAPGEVGLQTLRIPSHQHCCDLG